MILKKRHFSLLLASGIILFSCKKNNVDDENSKPRLIFKVKFDSTQTRLNNIGQPSVLAAGRAAQSPRFSSLSAHYFELSPNAFTPLGQGSILYKAPETSAGGANAIDFARGIRKGEQGEYFALKIKEIPAGTYEYLRVSLSYQNYDIDYLFQGMTNVGTAASFIGFNNYIGNHTIKNLGQSINANKPQGYWAFESNGTLISGQAPAGATTVPNPIFATSPIPQGSCVVTAAIVDANGNPKPLIVRGGEQKDINILLSFSTNKSFEWIDTNADGLFEPAAGEQIIDMGIRGLKPIIQ